MATPHIDAIARSLQSCSLNHHTQPVGNVGDGNEGGGGGVAQRSISATLDLNSQSSLPSHWEQCLDLKSGEIYFINWRTGMKAKEDPREYYLCNNKNNVMEFDDDWEEEDEEEGEDEDEECSSLYDYYDSTESSSPCSRSRSGIETTHHHEIENYYYNYHSKNDDVKEGEEEMSVSDHVVLVVAGCKRCLMYFMVPKLLQICPKCSSSQLLHFDPS